MFCASNAPVFKNRTFDNTSNRDSRVLVVCGTTVVRTRSFSSSAGTLNTRHGRTFATELRSPDLVKFAESFGALGIRVEDDSELPDALSRALEAEKPVIVDVVCGYDFPHPAPAEWLAEGAG